MTKFYILTLLIFNFFIGLVSATTVYNISLSGRDSIINTTIILTSEEKITRWDVFWILPDNSKILDIKDDKGEIEDYSIDGNNLRFLTNTDRSNTKKVFINFLIENVVDDKFKPVYSVDLSLPGISNEITIVNFKTNGLISGHASFNFSEKYENSYAELIGYGPINLRMFFSSEGKFYNNYIGFDNFSLSAADELYPIIQSVTGIDLPFKRFPVKILSDEKYNEIAKSWSSGTHLTGGLILIKESTMKTENNASIIIHETIHGYNSKVFSWQEANISWFDEGMGKFVEHLADKQLGNIEPEIFGGGIIYSTKGDKFILKSKGDREKLWNYYKNNENFIETWNLNQDNNRDFGYAFSELIIRDFVKKRGIEGLRLAYKYILDVDHVVNNSEEFNYILLKAMNYDLRPCYPNDRSKFETCLNDVNKLEIFIPNFNSTKLIKTEKNFTDDLRLEENISTTEENISTHILNDSSKTVITSETKQSLLSKAIKNIINFFARFFRK